MKISLFYNNWIFKNLDSIFSNIATIGASYTCNIAWYVAVYMHFILVWGLNDWWQNRLSKWGTPHHGWRNSAKRDSGTVYQDEPDQTPRNDAGFKIQDSSSSQDLRNQNQDAGIFESGDRMLVVCFLFYCLGSLQLWRLKGRFKQYLQ